MPLIDPQPERAAYEDVTHLVTRASFLNARTAAILRSLGDPQYHWKDGHTCTAPCDVDDTARFYLSPRLAPLLDQMVRGKSRAERVTSLFDAWAQANYRLTFPDDPPTIRVSYAWWEIVFDIYHDA